MNNNSYLPQELEKVPKGKLRVLTKKVGQAPSIEIIEDTLEAKQKLVGGLIEVVPFYDEKDILLICNEEGKILNMKPNLDIGYDYIAGDCFFVGDDYKNSGFKSLTREQILDIEEMLNEMSFEYLSKDEEMEK
jgi:hypothetical protein